MIETDDEFTVGPEAECETSTTLEDGTGECLMSYGDSGSSGQQTQRVGDEMGLVDMGASGHFTYDVMKLVGYTKFNRTLRCAGGATYPFVGTGSLEIHLQLGDGGAGGVRSAFLRWDTFQASSTT